MWASVQECPLRGAGEISDVPLGWRTDDRHRMRSRKISQGIVVDIVPPEGRRQIVEVSDHRGRKVEVQFTAGSIAHPEPVPGALRNEMNEPAGQTTSRSSRDMMYSPART